MPTPSGLSTTGINMAEYDHKPWYVDYYAGMPDRELMYHRTLRAGELAVLEFQLSMIDREITERGYEDEETRLEKPVDNS